MLAINKNLGKYAHEVLIVSSLLQEAVMSNIDFYCVVTLQCQCSNSGSPQVW